MATEQSIIDKLFCDYGDPDLRNKGFHGYRAAPRDARMFFSMRVLEAEIVNGGLAQFLWNAFLHWRGICDDCAFGYSTIGAMPQAAAMPEVVRILAAHESNCGAHVARAIASKSVLEFNAWYAVGETAMSSPVEKLFCQSGNLAELKQAWLSSHAGSNVC